jgi:hypothetical protein
MYLDINENAFSSLRDNAIEEAKSTLGDERVDELSFTNLEFLNPEYEFDEKDGSLTYYGSLSGFGKKGKVDFGYLSVDVKIDLDLAVKIIEFYMKKLGKLKTVLEATK